jgi:hypothetical protein
MFRYLAVGYIPSSFHGNTLRKTSRLGRVGSLPIPLTLIKSSMFSPYGPNQSHFTAQVHANTTCSGILASNQTAGSLLA